MRKLSVAINKNWQTAKFATQEKKSRKKGKVFMWELRGREILECNRITPWKKFLIGLSLYNTCDCSWCCYVYFKQTRTSIRKTLYDCVDFKGPNGEVFASSTIVKKASEKFVTSRLLNEKVYDSNCRRPLKCAHFMAGERFAETPLETQTSTHHAIINFSVINSFIKNMFSLYI